MNKKLICIVLSLVMASVGSMAFAASSKTTNDLTSAVLGANDSTLAVEYVALSADATAQLAEITAFVAGNAPVINYFGDAVAAEVAALLPVGFDATTLVMNELISARVSQYVPGTEDVPVFFTFATAYADGAVIVVLVGIKDGNSVTWVPLRAEVTGGLVKIFFTQSVLALINDREVMLAVLSAN